MVLCVALCEIVAPKIMFLLELMQSAACVMVTSPCPVLPMCLGLTSAASGDFQKCEQCLQDALDVLRTQVHATKDARLDLIVTELEIAKVCRCQFHMHAAVSHGEAALGLARALSDRPALVRCHLFLGRMRILLGLYPQAIFHFKTALTVSRKAANVRGQAWALYGLAEVNCGLQRPSSAVEYCKTLLALPSTSPNANTTDESPGQEGFVEPKCRCQTLLLLGKAHASLKELETAAAFLDEARLEAEELKSTLLQAYVNCEAGAVATEQGMHMRAYQLLKSTLDMAESISDQVLQMSCHYRLGISLTRCRQKSHLSAIEHFYIAIDLFTQLRHKSGSWSPDGKSVVELPLDCYECLQETLVGRGDIKEAFLVAEFALQRMFVDTVGVHQDLEDVQSIRTLPLKMPTLGDLSRQIATNGSGVLLYSFVHDSLYMWLCLPPRGLAAGVFTFHQWSAGAVRYLLPFLRQNYLLLSRLPSDVRDASRTCEGRSCCLVGGETMMYRSSAAGQMCDKQGDPPPYCPYGSIAQRQQLTYPWIGDEELLHPGRSGYLAAPAPREDINGVESRASMRDLFNVLAMPFERYLFGNGTLPVRDVTIVTSSGVLLCPFSALVTSRRVVVLDYYHYQFRFQPSIIPPVLHSARTCDACQAQGGLGSGVHALVAGNPAVPSVKFFGQTWRPLPLPYAEREVRSIGLLLGPSVTPVIGTSARRHTLLSLLPQANLIHLAMHVSWELCSLIVAPAAGVSSPSEKDVLISASDIARLHLQADLVVLSGGNAYCHSSRPGSGLPQPSQHNLPSSTSLLTMARAFLTAGARCVIMPLWSIPDRATDEFMFLFYEHLKQGVAVGQSLRQTMESIRSKRGFSEPVNWAPFIHFGEDLTLDFSSVQGVGVSRSASATTASSAATGTDANRSSVNGDSEPMPTAAASAATPEVSVEPAPLLDFSSSLENPDGSRNGVNRTESALRLTRGGGEHSSRKSFVHVLAHRIAS